MDEAKGRDLVDTAIMRPAENFDLEYLDTDGGRINIMPAIPMEAGHTYRIQLWSNATVTVWHMIADGIRAPMQ